MKAPSLLALSAAVLLSTGSMAAFQHSAGFHPANRFQGIDVVDLAPVTVSPSAQDRREAVLMNDLTASPAPGSVLPVAAIDLATVTVTPSSEEQLLAFTFNDAPALIDFSQSAKARSQALLLRPQLAMPYYSFGNAASFISKE